MRAPNRSCTRPAPKVPKKKAAPKTPLQPPRPPQPPSHLAPNRIPLHHSHLRRHVSTRRQCHAAIHHRLLDRIRRPNRFPRRLRLPRRLLHRHSKPQPHLLLRRLRAGHGQLSPAPHHRPQRVPANFHRSQSRLPPAVFQHHVETVPIGLHRLLAHCPHPQVATI